MHKQMRLNVFLSREDTVLDHARGTCIKDYKWLRSSSTDPRVHDDVSMSVNIGFGRIWLTKPVNTFFHASVNCRELTCTQSGGSFAPRQRSEPTLFSRHPPWPSLPAHSRTDTIQEEAGPLKSKDPSLLDTGPLHPLPDEASGEKLLPGGVKEGRSLFHLLVEAEEAQH